MYMCTKFDDCSCCSLYDTAFRKAKIVCNFGLSECKRVNIANLIMDADTDTDADANTYSDYDAGVIA